MKNLKKVFAIIISLTMVLSLFGAFSAQAESTVYNFYTHVGASFTPVTDGITWNNTDTIDTSVMGRQVITGTDSSGAAVKGFVNVGTQKWSSYQNNEANAIGEDVVYGSANKDQWRYEASGDVGTQLAVYTTDPRNSDNIVIKYNGGRKDSSSNYNQIAYYPATQTAIGNSYSVEFRIMADSAAIGDDTYSIQFRNSDKTVVSASLQDTLNLKRVDSGLAISLLGSDKATYEENPKADEWLNIKYTVYKEDDTFKSSISLNGEKILEVNTNMVINNQILPIQYIQLKNSGKDVENPVRFVGYIDDVKVTDLTTTDYIYYDSFDSEYNYEYMHSDGTQEMSINETVKFVTEAGSDSGYSTEIYASAVADTSKLGTFKSTTALPGFDDPLAISWTVYKEQLAWEETFENYTETDIGKAPSRSPWIAGTIGKTIAYENAEAEVKNTVLSYSSNIQDGDWLKMSDGKSIDGIFSVEWRFMLPELIKNSQFTFPLIRESGHPFIEPSVSINALGNGQFAFNHYDAAGTNAGSVYLVESGDLKANTWYKVKFTIDTQAQTFTYAFDDVEYAEKYGARYQNNSDAQAKPSFTQFRLAQRKADLSETATIYVDDIKVERILTIQEPVTKNITVYKGDEAVLPETTTVLLTDGETTDEAEVSWNGTIDTSTIGTKTITGTVTGTALPATLNVEVSAFPYEIVSANIKNGDAEVFGLIKGTALSSATLSKIANETKAGKVYAALYDESKKLIGANVVEIDESSEWNKDSHKDIAISLNLPNSNEIDIDTCTLKLFVISDILVPYATVKAQTNTDAQAATTVYIAGDSLAEAKSASSRPETGWGEAFAALDSNGLTVENRALGGRSSKSFYDQGLLKDILGEAKEGDYLFIQFGHNDSKESDATRYTTPVVGGTYEEYLTKYITEAREKGVIPVILTSVVRAKYDANDAFIGDVHSELDEYAAAAKRVAAAYHVPVIDLHSLTADKFSDMTKEETWKYFNYYADTTTLEVGNADTTHLNEAGAQLIANMIKTELENMRLPLYKLFN